MKKILSISIIILLIAGGYFLYNKYQAEKTPSNTVTLKSLFFSDNVNNGDNTKESSGLFGGVFNNNSLGSSIDNTQKQFQLKRLTNYPVASLVAYDLVTSKTIPADPKIKGSKSKVETSTKKVVRFVSRKNGYVYEVEGDGTPLQITNISIPNIYEAIFTNGNNNVLLRFLRGDKKTVATFNVPIPKENTDKTRTQIAGSFLPDNIVSIAVSPSTEKIAYLIPNLTGSTITISDFAGLKKSVFMESTFKDWLISWPTDKKLFFQTRASSTVPGFLYSVDTGDKKFRRVLGNVAGLTTNTSSDENTLYSQSLNSGFTTRILNNKDGSDKSIDLSILPEKCTWLKSSVVCAGNIESEGSMPDEWYQGIRTLSDKVYMIDLSTLRVQTIYDGSSGNFDMTHLSVDESSRRLYFIDKNTGELWRLSY